MGSTNAIPVPKNAFLGNKNAISTDPFFASFDNLSTKIRISRTINLKKHIFGHSRAQKRICCLFVNIFRRTLNRNYTQKQMRNDSRPSVSSRRGFTQSYTTGFSLARTITTSKAPLKSPTKKCNGRSAP